MLGTSGCAPGVAGVVLVTRSRPFAARAAFLPVAGMRSAPLPPRIWRTGGWW